MKVRMDDCPKCKQETKHRVRMRTYYNRTRNTSYPKYVVYHCTKCNERRYKR